MKINKVTKESLFVIPLGIILNIICIRIMDIKNLYLQALILVIIFIILTQIYRAVMSPNSK